MRIPGAFGGSFVSTHPCHGNKGIGNTPYEPDGEAWLRPVFARNAQAYPDVVLYER